MKRKRSWYHLDHLNSTKMVTDANGEIEVNYIYRAFGEQLKRLDSLGADTDDSAKYSYGGKELDDVTNLYYFNARYYDATIGRFINVDPVQDGTNWYVYTSNNPLNAVDPTGLRDYSYYYPTTHFKIGDPIDGNQYYRGTIGQTDDDIFDPPDINAHTVKVETEGRYTNNDVTNPGASAAFDGRFYKGNFYGEAEADLGTHESSTDNSFQGDPSKSVGAGAEGAITLTGANAKVGMENGGIVAEAEAFVWKGEGQVNVKVFGQNFYVKGGFMVGLGIGAGVGPKAVLATVGPLSLEVGYSGDFETMRNAPAVK